MAYPSLVRLLLGRSLLSPLSRSLGTAAALASAACAGAAETNPGGLLFYLSGDHGTTADVAAAGTAEPTFVSEVSQITDGAFGGALQCGDLQRLAFRAPGNIYAQRGTLSFFWRSRYAVGPTQFPIFRVGYADHSSWDMVWLRIDYNGHGFDAFVTDANLARTRVSVTLPTFPKPNEWTHLSLAWDETRGIRFFINGKLAEKQETTAVYNAALDQFGPHSRIISPYQVQSDYNFVRGGDIDEVRIYDRMLDDKSVSALAVNKASDVSSAEVTRSLADTRWSNEWALRYGWNRSKDLPAALPAAKTSVRKVEIHDAYDLGRWWWKANDGIRETTWPGVYNRSRLPGRHDYFTLPDWDCYVDSGKSVTFTMPDEPWNHIEIAGAAYGKVSLLKAGSANDTAPESVLFERAKGQEKTANTLPKSISGRKVRFDNVEQETPIGEFAAYNVTAAAEPTGSKKLSYRLTTSSDNSGSLAALRKFIDGRFAPDERATLVGVASDAGSMAPTAPAAQAARTAANSSLPLVHLLIPDTWDNVTDGLDGIAIDLPALKVKATQNGMFPLNLQVKDPLWPLRDMLDFTFSVKPGEAHTLWLDLRDRILPAGKGFYLTIAGAGADFNATALEGAEVRLVFKPRDAARAEHELDRFIQMRDSYAMLVEEHPRSPKLDLWNRFEGDLKDLLRVNPDHVLGRQYAAVGMDAPRPAFEQATPPSGVPLWAFRQTELLGQVKHFVMWYVDHRQSAYGDFGGGISDDVDLLNTWPGVALMGSEPDKLKVSLRRLIDAVYKNGMMTNGLPTLQADELHSYEEGINCLAQNLILNFGSPRQLERAMETSRGLETITGINSAGHRHVRTSYYSGTRMAIEDPWGVSKPYSTLVMQVPQLLVEFNGNPEIRKFTLELADGMLAHRHVDTNGQGTLATTIHYADDREGEATRGFYPWHLFWGAWKATGDRKYLAPLLDGGPASVMAINANAIDLLDQRKQANAIMLNANRAQPTEGKQKEGRGGARPGGGRATANNHFLWQLSGDKSYLEKLYASQIEECALMDYINTEGSLWIDRVSVPYAEIQRARLGGVALLRNSLYPGHVISWKFEAPANDQSVAVLVPNATATEFKVIAYNLSTSPVRASMTGWNIDPGMWEISQGVDTNNDDATDGDVATRTASFGRSQSLDLTLPPRASTILTLKLKTPGTPYWERPDLGLDREDVVVNGRTLKVTVHSLGSVASQPTRVVVRTSAGEIVANGAVPSLPAPTDLKPKTAQVSLSVPANAKLEGASVEIESAAGIEEITAMNNRVQL